MLIALPGRRHAFVAICGNIGQYLGKAAPVAPTRQCVRRALTKVAFTSITTMYPGESRLARRRMARAMAKNQWREQYVAAAA